MAADASVEALAEGVLGGDRRALAKAITLVESTRRDHRARAQQLLEKLLPATGRVPRVGISGVPGVGKSTFVEALGLMLIERELSVAVLAVDPSSRVSGGSILGDKTRMAELGTSPRAFIRPSPAGGSLGGVARRTREAMLVCEAAGFDVVLIETVGVGQSEHAVAGMVDTFVLLALAGAGDELQGIKRGILELCDVTLINKADGDGKERAARAAAEYRSAFRLLRGVASGHQPEVLTVSALHGDGMARAWDVIVAHRAQLQESGELQRKRAAQQREWLWSLVRDGIEAEFFARPEVQARRDAVEQAVVRGEITAAEGARRLLGRVPTD